MNLDPFETTVTTTVRRMMTPQEARDRLTELFPHLYDAAANWIVMQFEIANDFVEGLQDNHLDYDYCIRSNGRMGLLQSWESTIEELALLMGVPEEADYNDYPEVRKVFDAFFEE